MTEEKQLILNMLKDGKITVEQASDLLEAIGDKKKSDTENLAGKISSTVDNIIKKATETISGIDFDAIDITNYNLKGEINSHKDFKVDDQIDYINVDIVNGDIIIEKSTDPGILISADVYSKKPNLTDYIDVKIVDNKLNISNNRDYNGVSASLSLKISLDKDLYESLNIENVNGKIEVADTDFSTINIDTVNAKINLFNIKAAIDIDNVNGKIDIKNIDGKLAIDNVNGSVYLADLKGELAEIDTVNGNVRVDGLKSDKLSVDSERGSIRVFTIKDTKEIELETRNGNLVVDTAAYNGDVRAFVEGSSANITDKFVNKIKTDEGYEISTNNEKTDLEIKAESVFGKISIR